MTESIGRQLPDISTSELTFTYEELRKGREEGYHHWTNEYPLASYAVDHPEDMTTWVGPSAVTRKQYNSIIERNIQWHIATKGVQKKALAERMQRDRKTISKWLSNPSGMEAWSVRVLCDVLGVNLDALICVLSNDIDEDEMLPPDKLVAMYSGLSNRHRRMISDLVLELSDSENASRDYDNLLREFHRTTAEFFGYS